MGTTFAELTIGQIDQKNLALVHNRTKPQIDSRLDQHTVTLTHSPIPNTSSRPDKPGWGIFDRYMPEATPEAQKAAYESLRSLVQLLLQIGGRLVTEEIEMRPPLF